MFDFTVITFLVFRLCMHMDDVSILSILAYFLSYLAGNLFVFLKYYLTTVNAFNLDAWLIVISFLNFGFACTWITLSSLYYFICMLKTSLLFIQLTTCMHQFFCSQCSNFVRSDYYLFVGFNILFAKRYIFVRCSLYVPALSKKYLKNKILQIQ